MSSYSNVFNDNGYWILLFCEFNNNVNYIMIRILLHYGYIIVFRKNVQPNLLIKKYIFFPHLFFAKRKRKVKLKHDPCWEPLV